MSIDREPLITIGIPCFNAEDSIRRAVESALAQTWSTREILIVDDCSTDGSIAAIDEIEREHPEIRVIRREANGGFAAVANTIISEAQGELLTFFSDDDVSAPDRLSRQYRRIVDYEAAHTDAAVFCYSNGYVVEPGDQHPSSQRLAIGRVPPEPSGEVVADHALGLVKDDGVHCWGLFGSGTLLVRTEQLRRLDGFDARFRRGADVDLVVRAAFGGAHFIAVDEPLMTQYITPTADKADNVRLRSRLMLIEKHRPYLSAKRAYRGAWLNAYAQVYCSRGSRWWRLWYLAALVCFPWPIARERLRTSSIVGRLRVPRLATSRTS